VSFVFYLINRIYRGSASGVASR